jgi:hypothetical protein
MILAMTLLLFLCAGIFAQTSTPAQPVQPSLTGTILDRLKDPQQAKQLQQALDILQQVASTRAADTKDNGDHKTVGDALDKGLDMAKETVVYLAAKIEQVAPQLWQILRVQQYVKGAISLINPLGFLFVILLYRYLLLKWWKPQPGDDDATAPVKKMVRDSDGDNWPVPTHKGWRGLLSIALPLAMLVVGGIWFYSSISNAAGYFINPNYYALKDIIILVKNPGAF